MIQACYSYTAGWLNNLNTLLPVHADCFSHLLFLSLAASYITFLFYFKFSAVIFGVDVRIRH